MGFEFRVTKENKELIMSAFSILISDNEKIKFGEPCALGTIRIGEFLTCSPEMFPILS